jgi:hypothetical protein
MADPAAQPIAFIGGRPFQRLHGGQDESEQADPESI